MSAEYLENSATWIHCSVSSHNMLHRDGFIFSSYNQTLNISIRLNIGRAMRKQWLSILSHPLQRTNRKEEVSKKKSFLWADLNFITHVCSFQ